MQPWGRSPAEPSRNAPAHPAGVQSTRPLASQITRGVGLTLQRLGARITAASTGRRPRRDSAQETMLARARAALTDAREQMPGLMHTVPPVIAETVEQPQAAPAPAAGGSVTIAELPALALERDARSARVEEVIRRLEDERRELRSELGELRLIAQELRETLVRLDDRSLATSPDSIAPVWMPPRSERVYPAGSIGVELKVSGIRYPEEMERLRDALALRPEVDSVRVTRAKKRKARLRICMRLPVGRQLYLSMLRQAAPAATLLAGSRPGSVSLRLHPS